jgi:hypothetical protein
LPVGAACGSSRREARGGNSRWIHAGATAVPASTAARKKRVREVEDDLDMWTTHNSGSYEKGKLVKCKCGSHVSGLLSVKS